MARFITVSRARKPVIWLLSAALLVLVAGIVVPSFLTSRPLNLALNQDLHYTSRAEHALVTFTTDADVRRTDITMKRRTTISPADNDSHAMVDSLIDVYAGGTHLGHINDSLEVNRESTYPTVNGVNNQAITVEPFRVGLTNEHFNRDGLSYFFPAATEQRSYPYFDILRQDSFPLDYQGKETRGDLALYVFGHTLPAAEISFPPAKDPGGPENPDMPGLKKRAGEFYTQAELDHFSIPADTTVILKPFYRVERTIKVEPTTGIVVEKQLDVDIIFAQSSAEADETHAAGLVPEKRAIIIADLDSTARTQHSALQAAAPKIHQLKLLKAVTRCAKFLLALLLLAAGICYVRARPND